LFPSEFLEEHAEELDVVKREGKLQIPVLVWALVFGFAGGESRTLAGFRRSYNSTADETISPGGFYHRLTPSLVEYLCDLVQRGLDEVAVSDAVDADIDRFRDVMIADGTVLRLHGSFPTSSKPATRSRLERSSTCSTMPPSRRLNGST
jgi:putative transposase